ncbi:MAG: T9SS type A sorting domain-containing protein, partial [Bacteroidota bacterium]
KYGGPLTALYVSTNAGSSWSIVGGGFPSNDPTMGRIALAIARSNPQIIYALTAYANGNSRGLYKSTDGGTTWILINASVAGSSNYAWFNRTIAVSPMNPDILFCGGLSMEYSANGGTSFSFVAASHVDQHAVTFAPSNSSYIAIGNDGGVDYSTNGGASWSESRSLPITQFYAGEIDFNNPLTILGGTQDNGTPRTTNGGLSNWVSIYGGDGFYCLVDYTTSLRVYASSQNGGLGRSTNGGQTFISATSGLDRTYTNWMTPYVMDKNNPLKLYCGTYKIHKTTSGMQTWTVISPDLTSGHVQNLGTITTVDVAKSDSNVVYCGTDDANVWVTTNGGGNWTNIRAGLPYRWVTRVAVHPDSASVCYVTLSGYKIDTTGAHIYRTTNYGATWISIGGNLPDAPINDVVIDPANTRTLYIATDVGVMYTNDLGGSWHVLGTNFPTSVPCHDLTVHNPTRTLVAWTHGRSTFKITLPPPVGVDDGERSEPVAFRLEQNYPNPFNPITTIRYSLPSQSSNQAQRRDGPPAGEAGEGSHMTLKVYDILGREVATLVNEVLPPGNYDRTFDATGLASGVYFYGLTSEGVRMVRKMLVTK